jgi:hypothetical protein
MLRFGARKSTVGKVQETFVVKTEQRIVFMSCEGFHCSFSGVFVMMMGFYGFSWCF